MVLPIVMSLLLTGVAQIQVEEGVLEGQIVDNEFGTPFYSFKGIPYAEPPVGNLRFKAPVPKRPWEGVRNAKEHGSTCNALEQFTTEPVTPTGDEDCLFLNVYTPNITVVDPLPVMVFIHGGGFTCGSGDDDEYSPKFLIRKNVIFVTLNYRLEVFGFLSLDTEDVPGNAGMKDQVLALKWVKKNIRQFGGDPEKITIFGESAGGASVSFHLVSPMSKGLFKRAIMQSGTLTSWWPNTFRPRDRGLVLARQLGCYSNNDREIYECLILQPAEKFVDKRIKIAFAQYAKEAPNVYFGVVSERQFGNNERFFFGHPYDVARNSIHEDVEIMNGYTEDEGILYFSMGINASRVFEQANQFKEFFTPEPYTTNIPVTTQMVIGERFKQFYVQNATVSSDPVVLDKLLKYLNMEIFVYGIVSFQKIIAQRDKNKNYLYKFSCKSERNFFTNYTGLTDLFNYRTVVAHGDDLSYMFPMEYTGLVIDVNSDIFKVIEQVTTLWTNFAKYGDPTPDNSLGAKWLPYTLEDEDYLDIGLHLVPEKHPDKDQIDFWENNFREFLPEFLPSASSDIQLRVHLLISVIVMLLLLF